MHVIRSWVATSRAWSQQWGFPLPGKICGFQSPSQRQGWVPRSKRQPGELESPRDGRQLISQQFILNLPYINWQVWMQIWTAHSTFCPPANHTDTGDCQRECHLQRRAWKQESSNICRKSIVCINENRLNKQNNSIHVNKVNRENWTG